MSIGGQGQQACKVRPREVLGVLLEEQHGPEENQQRAAEPRDQDQLWDLLHRGRVPLPVESREGICKEERAHDGPHEQEKRREYAGKDLGAQLREIITRRGALQQSAVQLGCALQLP